MPHFAVARASACGLLLLSALAFAGCQNKAAGPPPRYAIVRFENLSGDPSLEWVCRAASEELAASLAGAMDGPVLSSVDLVMTNAVLGPRPATVPGISSERQRALIANATRLIAGYIERAGNQIRITATEEDVSTGRTRRTMSVEDSSPAAVIERLALQFSPHPKPPLTGNPAALRTYAMALESPIQTGVDGLEQAVRMDPRFGAAWVALANLELARGDRTAAEEVIDRARRQKLDPLSLARINLEAANLQPDQAARIDALRKVVALSPGDIVLLRSLTEMETAAGEFQAAATDWKRLTGEVPDDPLAWNSLGYALSFSGNYPGALAALQHYAQMRPKDANPQDSIGDLNYSFRRFQEAAAAWLRANDLQPGFERYGDLYKAAWAKFRAGDKPGADKLFARFRAEREKAGDVLASLLEADWLYRTGRMREAFDLLRKTVAETSSENLRSNAYSQLTIWELIAHDRMRAAKDSLSIGPRLTEPPMLIARFAALPSVPAAEWESRAEHLIPDSMASLRPTALAYALLLDGKREAARPVWAQIVKASPARDFFPRAVYDRLQGRQPEHVLVPDANSLNEFAAVLDAL